MNSFFAISSGTLCDKYSDRHTFASTARWILALSPLLCGSCSNYHLWLLPHAGAPYSGWQQLSDIQNRAHPPEFPAVFSILPCHAICKNADIHYSIFCRIGLWFFYSRRATTLAYLRRSNIGFCCRCIRVRRQGISSLSLPVSVTGLTWILSNCFIKELNLRLSTIL